MTKPLPGQRDSPGMHLKKQQSKRLLRNADAASRAFQSRMMSRTLRFTPLRERFGYECSCFPYYSMVKYKCGIRQAKRPAAADKDFEEDVYERTEISD